MYETSTSLLGRLAEHSTEADWLILNEVYRPFIHGVVSQYPDLASHADDVAQEVMLILMRELPTFQRQRTGSFRTWLRGITVNQMRMTIRKAKRFPQTPVSGIPLEQQIEDLANPMSQASLRWDQEHERIVFERIIEVVKSDFKPITWQAFQRYALDDQPPAEVARELGLSLNSVLLAKSRVLRRMRQEAKGLLEED